MKSLIARSRLLTFVKTRRLITQPSMSFSKIITEEETIENLRKRLENQMNEKQNLSEGYERLKVENANDRSSIVKNLSLQLLDVESPQKILDIFQSDYLE